MVGHVQDLIQKLKKLIEYDLNTCEAFMDIDVNYELGRNCLDEAKQVATTFHLLSMMATFSKKYELQLQSLLQELQMEMY